MRKNVTSPGFFRRREGSLNAHFTQVCFILTFLSALLLPSVQTTMPVNPKKLFYTFKGDCGTFKTVSPDLIREHQKDIKIKWMDKDNFSITLMVNGQEWYEEWTRVKRPDFFKKILKSTEL